MGCSACTSSTGALQASGSWAQWSASSRRAPRLRRRAVAVPRAATQQQDEAQVLVDVTRRIRDLGRRGKPREAIQELTAIAAKGVQPDVVAATALVDACARSGKPDMAVSIFDELFGGSMLQPDEVACAVLLRALGEANPPRWSAIATLLNRMEREFGLTIGTVTFNTLLAVCASTNDEARASELISRMEAQGCMPDEYTFEAVRTKRSMRSLLKRVFS